MKLLNILLVGFNDKEAKAIEVLTKVSTKLFFASISVSSVERHFSPNFRLVFPILTAKEMQSDALVIDVEGVGLDLFNQRSIQKLHDFSRKKPTLLVTRQHKKNYQYLLSGHYQILEMPYGRQAMQDALAQLIVACQSVLKTEKKSISIEEQSAVNHQQKPQIVAKPILQQRPTVPDLFQYTKPTTTQRQQTLKQTYQLLADTFDTITRTQFFEFCEKIQQLEQCAYVQIRMYSMYVNPFDKSVLTSHLERIVEQLTAICHEKSNRCLKIQLLTLGQYEQQVTPLLSQGGRKYAISQIIWQMGLKVVSRNDYQQKHALKLKVNYMPNLMTLPNLPNYVTPIIASCLNKVRQLDQLEILFPKLTIAQINQVIILMILSDIVNSPILLTSHTSASQKEANTMDNIVLEKQMNEGVKKAHRTDFFNRLIHQLNM